LQKKRISSLIPGLLPTDHPLHSAVPVKLLSHTLWAGGYYKDGRGDDCLKPKFQLHKSGMLVAKDEYNAYIDKIDIKAVRHDDQKKTLKHMEIYKHYLHSYNHMATIVTTIISIMPIKSLSMTIAGTVNMSMMINIIITTSTCINYYSNPS
jgi:hypothetical protein